MTRPQFPRPCRTEDIRALANEIPELGLIADGSADEIVSAFSYWRDLLPQSSIQAVVTDDAVQPALREAAERYGVEIGSAASGDLTGIPAGLAHIEIWASCRPYDSYGVVVKPEIERAVGRVIAGNAGAFISHDPVYGVFRVLPAALIDDRLKSRPARLRAYRCAIVVVSALAWLASRVTRADIGWRPMDVGEMRWNPFSRCAIRRRRS